jgi:hypothetical protein
MSAPDFHRIVSLALKPRNGREEESCRELADHLADEYEESLRCGQSSDCAAQKVLSQMEHPLRLRHRIRGAQGGGMSSIFKRLFLPGVLSVFVVRFFAITLGSLGFRPAVYPFWSHAVFVYYGYMVPGFCVAGAFGAWYSRHQGGSVRERLASGTFYAIASLCACLLPLPFAFVVDPNVAWATRFEIVTGYTLSQVIVPGMAMFIGTLPFLFSPKQAGKDVVAA